MAINFAGEKNKKSCFFQGARIFSATKTSGRLSKLMAVPYIMHLLGGVATTEEKKGN